MKKLVTRLPIILFGLSVSISAYSGETFPSNVNVPSYCGGFTFGLTGLYWRASSPQQGFGQSITDTVDPQLLFSEDSVSPFLGDIHHHHLDHDFDWGFKANIGYIFPCSGNDVNLAYTYYDNKRNKQFSEFEFPSVAALNFLTGLNIGPNFTFTDANISATITLPISLILQDPTFVTNDFSSTRSVESNFRNNTWDLDVGQTINVGCNTHVRFFSGLRYSKLDHKLLTTDDINISGFIPSVKIPGVDFVDNVILTGDFGVVATNPANLFDGAASVFGSIIFTFEEPSSLDLNLLVQDIVNRNSRFEGLGPRIGADINYQFCGGIGLVGRLSSALLVGRANNCFEERVVASGSVVTNDALDVSFVTQASAGFPITIDESSPYPIVGEVAFKSINQNETRVVPNLEAKLGLNYTHQFSNCSHSRVTLEVGWEIDHFFNSIDNLSETDIASEFNDHRNTVDVGFDGPYVSIQVSV